MSDLEKQAENKPKRDEKGRLLPGGTANPNGRPKGKTIKELVREHLETHPDDMKEFVKHFIKRNRELAWQMLEGRPQQDVTSGGEKLPTPLLANINVPNNNSNPEDSGSTEEN
jgi:hypothetical protein